MKTTTYIRSNNIGTLLGLAPVKGTFNLYQALLDITTPETAEDIIRCVNERIRERKATRVALGLECDLGSPLFSFVLPERKFDYKRLAIRFDFPHAENVKEQLVLAFVKDEEFPADDMAIPEDRISVLEGTSWFNLMVALTHPRVKGVIKQIPDGFADAIGNSYKDFKARECAEPTTKLHYRIALVPEGFTLNISHGETAAHFSTSIDGIDFSTIGFRFTR